MYKISNRITGKKPKLFSGSKHTIFLPGVKHLFNRTDAPENTSKLTCAFLSQQKLPTHCIKYLWMHNREECNLI